MDLSSPSHKPVNFVVTGTELLRTAQSFIALQSRNCAGGEDEENIRRACLAEFLDYVKVKASKSPSPTEVDDSSSSRSDEPDLTSSGPPSSRGSGELNLAVDQLSADP